MKKHRSTIVIVLALLIGLSLLLYPTVSDYWNSFHQSQAITNYSKQIAQLDGTAYQEVLNNARKYNKALAGRASNFVLTPQEQQTYQGLLNVSGNGVMGYIEIPLINCFLPVYHGTSDDVLQVAIGHLEGSSLPVGGESTHAVLSGHRGLPSAKLFSNLGKLREGDTFVLHILDEILTYEVDQILIVLPEEVDALKIEQGKDYCTLVTCTPYGVNSHRMLVRGHRVDNAAAAVRVTGDAMQVDPVVVAPFVAIPLLLLLTAWLMIHYRKKKENAT